MNILITPPEELYKEATEIQEYLDITMSEDGDEAAEMGNSLIVYVGRTAKMLADAKYHLNEKKQSGIMKTLEETAKKVPNATNTAVNELIKSVCRDEQYLVDWLDRLNAASTHKVEWCRTLISKAKAELSLRAMNKN